MDDTRAVLALADGTVMFGQSFGAKGSVCGELVFNTAMTGYQEILTDPSYAEQVVTLTYPHIGNTGCNELDMESDRSYVKGLIVRNKPTNPSNWQSEHSLADFLIRQKVVAVYDLDTRAIVNRLREQGTVNVCLSTELSGQQALEKAKSFTGLAKANLAKEVSTKQHYTLESKNRAKKPLHIVAYDFGIKRSILNLLQKEGFKITVVPYTTSIEELMKLKPQGVFLSNGPGDPAACTSALANIKTLLEMKMPMFGICLGFQLLGLALGAKSYKMKFGHHGANHPVKSFSNDRNVLISSQNHGFAIDEKSLPEGVEVSYRSLFDGSLQGFNYNNVMGFQGHPEAGPGPNDLTFMFEEFFKLCAIQSQ